MAESPAWQYSLFIEHGENNLPVFKFVNDSDEFLIDGRIRLVGWKYRILELTKEQLKQLRDKSRGRLTFKIINTTGLPVVVRSFRITSQVRLETNNRKR